MKKPYRLFNQPSHNITSKVKNNNISHRSLDMWIAENFAKTVLLIPPSPQLPRLLVGGIKGRKPEEKANKGKHDPLTESKYYR